MNAHRQQQRLHSRGDLLPLAPTPHYPHYPAHNRRQNGARCVAQQAENRHVEPEYEHVDVGLGIVFLVQHGEDEGEQLKHNNPIHRHLSSVGFSRTIWFDENLKEHEHCGHDDPGYPLHPRPLLPDDHRHRRDTRSFEQLNQFPKVGPRPHVLMQHPQCVPHRERVVERGEGRERFRCRWDARFSGETAMCCEILCHHSLL
mmetsp:Transcript_2801/g.7246  ORF Transcript_2801/g.7246 Transcript_2801/m.7246 type:complete len:201 (-) Transcript_2801:450-1052(-)